MRIAITGLGVIAPTGIGKQSFWDGLINGTSCIIDAPWPDAGQMRCRKVCSVFATGAREKQEMGNDVLFFALEAVREAWTDAGFSDDQRPRHVGITLGTAVGGAETSLMSSASCAPEPGQTPAQFISRILGLSGPVVTLPVACAAGAMALVHGALQIEYGRADAMLVVGADSVSAVPYAGFSSLNVLTDDRIRPFDRNRSGFFIAEGAGALVLERMDDAQRRGALIYGEVKGFGLSADAYHIVHPHPGSKGLIASMSHALRMAGCSPDDVDYINAHGTATIANDRSECIAMRTVFSSRSIPTSSYKAVLGHTMGAAGAIETVGCLLALHHQLIPPTWNFESPDPECPIDCVPNEARAAPLRTILKNSSGFGGSNCSLLIGRC